MASHILSLIVAAKMDTENNIMISRIFCHSGNDEFQISGLQFRIHIFFGLTINKAQGISFRGKPVLDLT